MANFKRITKKLDDKSLNPNELSREQRAIIDELINRGELKGPTMRLLHFRETKLQKILQEQINFMQIQ